MQPYLLALFGTSIAFIMTAMGAGMVFFFKNKITEKTQQLFLGFASGIMLAASFFSLILPALEMSADMGKFSWLPAAGGFLIGAFSMLIIDQLLPHMHAFANTYEGAASKLRRTTMLILAVTLHNIPEGMAVGLAFGMSANEGSIISFSSALALAIGIGLQNFPEGAAISLPLKNEGFSNGKAFVYGSLSGLVEPIFGVLTVLIMPVVTPVMPWVLAFAAGAMVYVVAEELIPEANMGSHSNLGTVALVIGFAIMMVLDLALG